MTPSLARWAFAQVFRQPLAWLALVAAAGLDPLLASLNPWTEPGHMAWIGCLPAGLVGATLAVHTLGQQSNILRRATPGARWGVEVTVLFGATAVLQAPLVVTLLLSGAPPAPIAWLQLALLDLHLAGAGVVLLRFPLPDPWRPLLFLTILWGAAGGLPLGRAGALVLPVLDISRHLTRQPAFVGAPLAALAAVGPSLGLLLTAWLALARPPAGTGIART